MPGLGAALFNCCCASNETAFEQDQAVGLNERKDGSYAADEGRKGEPPLYVPRSEEGKRAGPGQDQSNAASDTTPPSTARSEMTPEEKRKEKQRLQEMVKEFAKEVVLGQPCQCLADEDPSKPLPPPRNAVYGIDKYLKTFRLRKNPPETPSEEAESGSLEVSLDMTRIEDVVKDAQLTSFANSRQRAKAWGILDFQQRFVCVQFSSAQQTGTQEMGLLMPNAYERERFFTCMKILRWAMDSRRAGA